MSTIQYNITPRELLDKLGLRYKVNGQWLGFKLCPVCGGGEAGRDQWTFAVHSKDGNYNCLRDSCDAKGSFWGLMLFYQVNPREHVLKDGNIKKKHGKGRRYVYGKR